MGGGGGLGREIRPEGESADGGRGGKTLGVGSGWAWQGFFLTDATMSLELIHMEESQGREEGIHLQSMLILHLLLQFQNASSWFIPTALGKKWGGTVIPILQKGKTEAHSGELICSRPHRVRDGVES